MLIPTPLMALFPVLSPTHFHCPPVLRATHSIFSLVSLPLQDGLGRHFMSPEATAAKATTQVNTGEA